MADIAAAALFLSVGEKQIEPGNGTVSNQFSFSEEGMTQLFINVGRKHGVSPGDIVGAIANEADIPGKVIGAIDVNDVYTLVDIPSELVEKVLGKMRHSLIRKQPMNMRLASTGEKENVRESSRGRDSGPVQRPPKKKFKAKAKVKTKRKRKGPTGPFFGNFTKTKKKKK